jgi:hypothetical protein
MEITSSPVAFLNDINFPSTTISETHCSPPSNSSLPLPT